jgi:hypothetical protein
MQSPFKNPVYCHTHTTWHIYIYIYFKTDVETVKTRIYFMPCTLLHYSLRLKNIKQNIFVMLYILRIIGMIMIKFHSARL